MHLTVQTLVIGAGQAGLALSHGLSARGHDHLVIDRGRVAERWRSERWDAFSLLTPNWQTRLPGWSYDGPDPEGFMGRDEVVDFFDRYAASFGAPVSSGVAVEHLHPRDEGRVRFHVHTSRGLLKARNVVVATGHYGPPRTPASAANIAHDVTQLHSRDYRNPDALPEGGVLVVGSGPTGQQLALELAEAGRRVHLAAGRHRTLPRRYRGHDSWWWLEAMGRFDVKADTLPDVAAARRAPSVVVSGRRGDLDLRRLHDAGVTIHGRLVAAADTRVSFGGGLAEILVEADTASTRFRAAVDAFVTQRGWTVPTEQWPVHDTAPEWAVRSPTTPGGSQGGSGPPFPGGSQGGSGPPFHLDLRRAGITTVLWATGFGQDYRWIKAPVIASNGDPIQRRGVTPVPGLAFLGLRWMHRRSSSFIDGVGADATYLAKVLTGEQDAAAAA